MQDLASRRTVRGLVRTPRLRRDLAMGDMSPAGPFLEKGTALSLISDDGVEETSDPEEATQDA